MPGSGPLRVIARAVTVLVVGVVVAVALLGNSVLPGAQGPDKFATPTIGGADSSGVSPSTPRPHADQSFVPAPAPTVFAVTNPEGLKSNDPVDEQAFIGPARSLTGFAGLWMDRNQRDYHIAIAGDVPAAIDALKPLIPSGITVYFHGAAHTFAELEDLAASVMADRDELIGMGIWTGFLAVDEKGNFVQVGVDPLEPEIAELMRQRYGDAVVLEYSPKPPPFLNTPWPSEPEVLHAISRPAGARMLTCGSQLFPESALSDPGGAEKHPGPVYDGLRETLRVFGTEFQGAAKLNWILVYEDDTNASFMAQQGDLWLQASTALEDGRWYAAGMGQCRPRTTIGGGFGSAEWALDPDYPSPDEESSEIHALVWELACSGGRPTSGRMSDPLIETTEGELIIAIGVEPIQGGATCPGTRGTPVTIVLPEAVGDRELLDGGRYPPAPPTEPF